MSSTGSSSARMPSSPSLRYSLRVQRRVRIGYVVMSATSAQAVQRFRKDVGDGDADVRTRHRDDGRSGRDDRAIEISPAELSSRVGAGPLVDLNLPVHDADD